MIGAFLFAARRSRSVASLKESVSIRNAVHETTVAFYLARSYAISRDRNVGLKFRKNGDRYEWALYVDGNGNGVRTRRDRERRRPLRRHHLPVVAQRRAARDHDRHPRARSGQRRADTSTGSTIRSDSTTPTSAPSRRSATPRPAPSTSGTRTTGWPSCVSSARRRRSGRSTTDAGREAGRDDRSRSSRRRLSQSCSIGERETVGARSSPAGLPASVSSGAPPRSPGRPRIDPEPSPYPTHRVRPCGSRGPGRRPVRPAAAGRPSRADPESPAASRPRRGAGRSRLR